MQPKDTAQEYDPMTTQKTTENWLRRPAAALLTLLVLAGVCLAVLGSLRGQAHAPQTVSAPVAAAAPAVSSQPDARTYEQSMARLRDINAVVAPSDPGASFHSVARDYAPYMYRLLELNTMDDPAAGGLPPTRDATQRTGPY